MAFDKLTWIGLMVVALGWAMLLSGAPTIEIFAKVLGRANGLPFNMAMIAQATILTGLGLAILGALQTGFSALKQFFDTVVERTSRSGEPPAMPGKIVERGRLKNRPYVLFGDGTIEVETLLGMRRFASFKDAHEFIGR